MILIIKNSKFTGNIYLKVELFQLLEGFIEEFFDQNPISQMGLISMRNKRAEKVSELAGNARKHISVIQTQFTLPSQVTDK